MNPIDIASHGPVIPVIVIDRVEDALPLAEALLAGGVKVLEVTLRTAAALPAIEAIARHLPEALVGVGTVLNADDARRASEAGARFAVSPGYTSDVGHACKGLGLPLLAASARCGHVQRNHGRAGRWVLVPQAVSGRGCWWYPLAQGVGQSVWAGELLPHGGHQPGHRPQLPGFAQCALRGWLVVDACRRHAPGRLGAYHPVGTRHTRFARASLRARWGRGLPPYQRTFTRMPPSSGLVSVLICSR